ncbi:MAG TPA: MBL fold metallo-hydrolase [Verrucomicrobiota bacterium]|nr:MBL fold metallo-hydrolase [Verrucomicrobiota bacterium]
MNLEDHLGDIIRKGRLMSDVSAAAAAKAAGISESELADMEDSGRPVGKLNYAALASLIGQDGTKLESVANGWLPSPKDLNRWRRMRDFTTTGEGLTVNCYLVWDVATREAALFDTGWDSKPILETIGREKLALRHLFLTHLHHDHVAELGAIRSAFPDVALHSNSRNAPANRRNLPDDSVAIGNLRVANRSTPGHAEEGVTYIITGWPDNAPAVAIVGDAIFSASMGRGNQSWEIARQKVREHILSLPPETLLCPGHGPLTTVAEEKAHNPFF